MTSAQIALGPNVLFTLNGSALQRAIVRSMFRSILRRITHHLPTSGLLGTKIQSWWCSYFPGLVLDLRITFANPIQHSPFVSFLSFIKSLSSIWSASFLGYTLRKFYLPLALPIFPLHSLLLASFGICNHHLVASVSTFNLFFHPLLFPSSARFSARDLGSLCLWCVNAHQLNENKI